MADKQSGEEDEITMKRKRNNRNQQRRRANMTEEELEKKRAYDRARYKRIKSKMHPSENDNDAGSSPSFQSSRLKVLDFKKRIESDMKFYGIDSEYLLFEKKLELLNIIECEKCDTFYWSNHRTCYCNKHSDMVKLLMQIGEIPEELKGLSYVEELLISKVHPMISVYRLKGGQYAFKGNVINFRQDVAQFCKQLPHSIAVLNGLISVCCKTECFHEDFLIRRNKVSVALHWLKMNNIYYKDIIIDLEKILLLPDNGYYSNVVNIDSEEEAFSGTDDDHPNEIDRVVVPGIGPISTADKLKHQIEWPRICSDPINEFNSKGYIAQAFPVLFPYGRGDFLDIKRNNLSARVYFQYLMQKCDRRFSKHKLFPYFALNSILRWEALTLGMLYVKKKPELNDINIENLKDMLNESMKLPKSVMLSSSSLRGSKAYWMSRTYELDSLVDRFGLPTIFFSVSAADHHWPRQFEILLSCNHEEVTMNKLTEKDRRRLLIDNADICADYFYESITIFVTEVMVPFLKAVEYWFRFEWQMRGVAHIHGVLWLVDAPPVIGFEKMTSPEKQRIIDYFSSLISAWNPNCQYVVTATHPCRIKVSEVLDREADLAALVNTMQKHTCSVHCLRKVKKSNNESSKSLVCKHHFPHKLQEESSVEKNERGHLEFFPKRNDPLVNKFSEFFAPVIRSNHDLTAILTYNGFVRYISKYASKGEIKSQDLLKILKYIVFKSDAEESVKCVIQKLFVNLAADRDFSFQEVIHILKGHKLYECSRTFVVLNLSEVEWHAKGDLSIISSDSKTSSKCLDVFECYSSRPQKYEKMSLLESMKWFDIKTFKKYVKERVVRIIPRFKESNDSVVSEAIWRQNALLNIPWRDYESLLLNDSWEFTCSVHGINLDMFPYVVSICEEEMSDEDDDGNYDNKMTEDDWMKLCRMCGTEDDSKNSELGKRLIDISYPWTDNVCDEYFADLIFNFISSSKKNSDVCKVPSKLPISSPDQQNVIEILKRQIMFCKTPDVCQTKIPRISVCEGFAGSGKSILLQSMVSLISSEIGDGSSLILAPTGSAALHVNGQTIHSALRLNWRDFGNMPDLKGEVLFKWKEKYEHVKFVFVEEYSMVGCKLIYALHKRLCQLTELSGSFGNLFVWFMGNIRQLPPVGDTPWYREDISNSQAIVVAGSLLYKEIDLVCFLSSQLRQQNLQYLQCLEHMSVGKLTDSDKVILQSRFRTISQIEKSLEFVDAVHLFSRRKDVDLYNLQKLIQENKPVLKIDSENSSRYAKACTSDQAMGLPLNLYLSIGCRVMLKRNLWIDGGLVNGSLGTVIDIVYQSSTDSSPIAIIVKFDSYYGPVLPNGGVPIIRYTNSWYSKNILCSRVMFPLVLAYAVTIYKSQGLTLAKVVIHIISKEMAAGEFYVGFSRVKSPNDICIIYDGLVENCPIFHLNPEIYREKVIAEEKMILKASRAV